MKAIECMKTRRSRRLFLAKEVTEEAIREILECAIAAPSSMDCQPWHFVLVRERAKRERLAALKSEDNQQHILTAPVAIVVCVDTEKSPSRYVEDGVTATENILLAAHERGLGSVYVTGFSSEKPEVAAEVRKILGIPEAVMPITILPLGYFDPEEKLEEKKLVELDEVIHEEGW